MTDQECFRYKCTGKVVGEDHGAPACYYHESRASYLTRQKLEKMERQGPPIPSNVSPNDPTWRS